MTAPRTQSRLGPWWRLALSALAVLATFTLVDARGRWSQQGGVHSGWLIAALLLAGLQFGVLAARWWFFCRRLQVPLGYGRALVEYFLSTFLNQVLPLGVLGDAARAARHTSALGSGHRPDGAFSAALSAVVLERASGQVGLWLVVLCVAPAWWRKLAAGGLGLVLAVLGLGVALALALALRSERVRQTLFGQAARRGIAALARPGNVVVHLPLSVLLVLTHVVGFWLVAQALGFALSLPAALGIVPPLLVAATVPAFFAGFGVREAAAAGLYQLSGLDPAAGATVSLVYGVVGLLASTPGAFVPFASRSHAAPKASRATAPH